jgi:hypothetical protein
MSPSGLAPLLARGAAIFGGLAAALLVGELTARRFYFSPRTFDPDFGWVIEQGATTRWGLEGEATGHWAARSVRGSWDEARDRDPILVAGDSMTEALEVDDDQTFTARAAAELRAMGKDRALLNIGSGGQRAPTYCAYAPAYKRVFKPTWTVLAINDDDLEGDMFDKSSSYFVLEHDARGQDHLKLQYVAPEGGGGPLFIMYRRMRGKSALIQLSAQQALGFRTDAALTRARMFRASAESPAPPLPRASDYPVQAALGELVKAFDGRLTILFLSSFDPDAPDRPTDVELEVRRFCEGGTSCVFAGDAWPDFARRHATPFGFPNSGWNHGHPNVEGHRAIGALLARELARLSDRALF